MTSDPLRAYRVTTKPRVERQLARLGKRDYLSVRQSIDDLTDQPRPRGVLKLRGDRYRLRWGNWRVVYEIDDEARLVTIVDVLRRNERTYRDL